MPHARVLDLMDKRDTIVGAVAYSLWEKAGRPDGQSDRFWYEAEAELRRRFNNFLVHMTPQQTDGLCRVAAIETMNNHL